MTEAERRKLGALRRLVYQNLANGVPSAAIKEGLHVSDLEIAQVQAFVGRKINENRTIRREPVIACGTLAEIRYNRRHLLGVLSLIGDLDLSTDLILTKLTTQSLDHPSMLTEAAHRMQSAA